MRAKELLAACFALFTALLVWPLLSIPNRPVLVGGIPGIVLYLFTVWGLVVAVLAWAARRAGEDGP
jgi:hypothetical protein